MKETFLKTVMEGAGIGRKKAEYLWQIGVRLPAEQHQGEPVAWRVATGNSYRSYDFLSDAKAAIAHWKSTFPNGELKVEPLYTHADPGEVERLRELLSEVLSEVPHGWGASFSESDLAERIRNALEVES